MAIFTEQFTDDYVVVDLETTGLSPVTEAIIEIAAVKVTGGRIVDTFSSLVDPKKHISSLITDITGIDDSMVRGQPSIDSVIPDFMSFAGELPLLGHNLISFDMLFLKKQTDISSKCIDTLRIARQLDLGECGHSLSALCGHFGIVNDNAHRALSDCIATHEVYCRLKQHFAEKGAFISCAPACGRNVFQRNIPVKCCKGTCLTLGTDRTGRLELYSGDAPVGLVPAGREAEIRDNIPLISEIKVREVKQNENGKFGLGVDFRLALSDNDRQ